MIGSINPSPFHLHPLILVSAFLLDLVLGDPRWLPHPVRVMGIAISRTEALLRRHLTSPFQEKLAGIVLVVLIVFPVFWITFLVNVIICRSFQSSAFSVTAIFGALALIYLTFTTIAVRELINAGRRVIESIKDKDMAAAKSNLAMIVGRDTENLSEKEILKATMETLSENLSDGIVAPLFYLLIGGLPLAMTYKAINTLDSMVGYKNERYKNFGWAAARLDDIANYIPARITGLLIILSSALFSCSLSTAHNSFKIMVRDGRKHSSPNSGIPEAAMAGALGVMLGGPSTYGGILNEKPYIGQDLGGSYLSASGYTTRIVMVASLLSLGIAAMTLYLRSLS